MMATPIPCSGKQPCELPARIGVGLQPAQQLCGVLKQAELLCVAAELHQIPDCLFHTKNTSTTAQQQAMPC